MIITDGDQPWRRPHEQFLPAESALDADAVPGAAERLKTDGSGVV
jgi:hypothetical protein